MPVRGYIFEAFMELSRLAADTVEELSPSIHQASELMLHTLLSGNKILACGNGGSAADAQHFVAEMVGRMAIERRALPAIALTVDPSITTALGNDYGFDRLFARQLEALGRPGDLLLSITTSGRSPNVLRAIETALKQGMHNVVLAGPGGDLTLRDSDVCVRIPSANQQRIQEMHMVVLHLLCDHIERGVVEASDPATPTPDSPNRPL